MVFFFFQAEDGIRDLYVTGVQTLCSSDLGVHARQGIVPLWQAIGATWLGTMIGSSVLYFASRKAGRGLVYRYGRFIRLTPEIGRASCRERVWISVAGVWLSRREGRRWLYV